MERCRHELTAVDAGKFPDVTAAKHLKRHLRLCCDFPECILQLVKDSSRLDDAVELNAPTDVQLVLLPASSVAEGKVADELIGASSTGKVETVRMLLAAGAHVDLKNRFGDTALICASGYGRREVARLLVEARASVNLGNRYSVTSLACASENGHTEIVRVLLAANACAFAGGDPTSWFHTAILRASTNGHFEIVCLLLEARADISLNKIQKTALVAASEGGHVEVVQVLLGASASADLVSGDFLACLALAFENSHFSSGSCLGGSHSQTEPTCISQLCNRRQPH